MWIKSQNGDIIINVKNSRGLYVTPFMNNIETLEDRMVLGSYHNFDTAKNVLRYILEEIQEEYELEESCRIVEMPGPYDEDLIVYGIGDEVVVKYWDDSSAETNMWAMADIKGTVKKVHVPDEDYKYYRYDVEVVDAHGSATILGERAPFELKLFVGDKDD